MKAGFTVSTMNIRPYMLHSNLIWHHEFTIERFSLFNHQYKLASIQTLSSLKTGTPPLRGGVDGPLSGGSTFVSGGSTPPLRGGWINPWRRGRRRGRPARSLPSSGNGRRKPRSKPEAGGERPAKAGDEQYTSPGRGSLAGTKPCSQIRVVYSLATVEGDMGRYGGTDFSRPHTPSKSLHHIRPKFSRIRNTLIFWNMPSSWMRGMAGLYKGVFC